MIDRQGRLRILIVDDHALFRESLARLLASEPDLEVVGTYGMTSEAAAALKDQHPDLLLLDFDFGAHNCKEFVRSAVQEGFGGRIMLVTAGLAPGQAAELVRAGVVGIFLKNEPPEQLLQAIHDVAGGMVWLDQKVLQSSFAKASADRRTPPLTDRERRVLSHILEGLTNKEIADRLSVSEAAVKASVQQLFSKSGVRSRGQLVRVALEKGTDLL